MKRFLHAFLLSLLLSGSLSAQLPTSNLTAHFDASNTDDLFTTAGNPPSGTPNDGDPVQEWDDEPSADIALIETTNPPAFRSTTPLLHLSNVDYDGTNDQSLPSTDDGLTRKTWESVSTTTDIMFLGAIRVEDVSTNAANIWDNDALIADDAQWAGMHFKNNAGAVTIHWYNFDAAADIVELSIQLNKNYVFAAWHDSDGSGNLYLGLYDENGLVSEGTVASDTRDGNGNLRIAANGGAAQFVGIRVGEFAIYSVYNATDFASAITYFRNKWFPTAVAPTPGRRIMLRRGE